MLFVLFLNIIFLFIFTFLQQIFAQGAEDTLSIDLAAQTITIDTTGAQEKFEINSYKKTCLLNGYDDIDYLLNMKPEIEAYEKANQ